MYHALYGNLRPWSVISNESSLGKIGHDEWGINKTIEFYNVLATAKSSRFSCLTRDYAYTIMSRSNAVNRTSIFRKKAYRERLAAEKP